LSKPRVNAISVFPSLSVVAKKNTFLLKLWIDFFLPTG